MSETARILGRPDVCDLGNGVTLKFEPINDTIRVEAEEEVERVVRQKFNKALEVATDAKQSALRDELAEAFARGEYDFGTKKFMDVLNTAALQIWLAVRLTKKHQPDMSRDELVDLLARHGDEIKAFFENRQKDAAKNSHGARKPPAKKGV